MSEAYSQATATIIRGDCPTNYTHIANSLIDDQALTPDAGFVLVWLLSKPPHWRVNPVAIANRFDIGVKKVWKILNLLVSSGYVSRTQERGEGHKFKSYIYRVFGTLEARKAWEAENETDSVPHSQKGSTDNSQEKTALPKTAVRKMGALVTNESSNSLRSEEKSADAGASAPSVSKQIWEEGKDLLSQASSQTNPSIIGKWLKRVPTPEGKGKLLGMIRAAAGAGTADPVSYVSAALAKDFPPLPEAKTFASDKWAIIHKATIRTRDWSSAWGPPPGKKGCHMPPQFITNELIAALSARKIAA
jgi:hypothetical protein